MLKFTIPVVAALAITCCSLPNAMHLNAAHDSQTNARNSVSAAAQMRASLSAEAGQSSVTTGHMLSGTGKPLDSVGMNGDLYHRTDVPSIYGPKVGGAWPSTYSIILGRGCTTAYHIDWDCDGYGVGTDPRDPNPLFGPDADDNDATVNTAASVIAKYRTIADFLTHLGYPTNRIWYISNSGDDRTGKGSADRPYATWCGVVRAQDNGAGGTVLFRQGAYTTATLTEGTARCPSYEAGASNPSRPLVLMSYPGEAARFVVANGAVQAGENTILDGLILYPARCHNGTGPGCGLGDGVAGWNRNHFTIRNTELAYWMHGILMGGSPKRGTYGPVLQRVIIRDNAVHGIYFTTFDLQNKPPTAPFNFDKWSASPDGYGPFVNVVLEDSIIHDNGSGGYEGIHINCISNGAVIQRNIIYNGGGTGIGLQNGTYNTLIQNNLIFGNSGAAITLSTYGDTRNNPPSYPSFIDGTVVVNNTIFTGKNIPPVGSQPPSYGILVNDYSADYPVVHSIKNTTIKNNVIVTYNGGKLANVSFLNGSYPDTNYIQNNLFYNAHPGNNAAAVLYMMPPNAECVARGENEGCCTGAGAGNCKLPTAFATGYYNFNKLQAYNTGAVNGNLWASPGFTDVQADYSTAPHRFNFNPASGSPVAGRGMAAGAPSTDLQGNTRGNPPSIGAYEVGSRHVVIFTTGR